MATAGGSATHPITTAFPLIADVIGGIRVERRIEIDQVNALGRDAIAENLEVVAVVARAETLQDAAVKLRRLSVYLGGPGAREALGRGAGGSGEGCGARVERAVMS